MSYIIRCTHFKLRQFVQAFLPKTKSLPVGRVLQSEWLRRSDRSDIPFEEGPMWFDVILKKSNIM